MAFLHFVENVHGVVGVHFRNEAGRVVGVHVFQNVAGHLLVEFREGLGRFFRGKVREHAQLLVQGELFKVFRTVGGVNEVVAADVASAKFQPRFPGAGLVLGEILLFLRVFFRLSGSGGVFGRGLFRGGLLGSGGVEGGGAFLFLHAAGRLFVHGLFLRKGMILRSLKHGGIGFFFHVRLCFFTHIMHSPQTLLTNRERSPSLLLHSIPR